MVKSCAAYDCKERYKKGRNLSFHQFPTNPELRRKWIFATKRINFNPSKYSYLCSKHFNKSCFNTERLGGLIVLKKDAVPTLFEHDSLKENSVLLENIMVLKFKQKQPTGSKTDQISTNTQSVSSVPIEYKLETLEAADEPILEICDIKTEPEDSDSCGNSAQSIIKPVLDNSGAEQLSLNENIDPLNNCDTTYNTSDNKNQNSSEDFFTDLSKNIIEQLKVFPLEHAIIMADKMQNFIAQERSKFKI